MDNSFGCGFLDDGYGLDQIHSGRFGGIFTHSGSYIFDRIFYPGLVIHISQASDFALFVPFQCGFVICQVCFSSLSKLIKLN